MVNKKVIWLFLLILVLLAVFSFAYLDFGSDSSEKRPNKISGAAVSIYESEEPEIYDPIDSSTG